MSILFSRLVRLAAQKIVFSPQVRSAAARAAHEAVGEAKLIVREKDKARAAGRSVRRIIGKLQGDRDGS
jgi:hypothetical protein